MPMPPLRPLLVRDVAEFHVRIARRPALLKPDAGQGDDEGAPHGKDSFIPTKSHVKSSQVKSVLGAEYVGKQGRRSWAPAQGVSGY